MHIKASEYEGKQASSNANLMNAGNTLNISSALPLPLAIVMLLIMMIWCSKSNLDNPNVCMYEWKSKSSQKESIKVAADGVEDDDAMVWLFAKK